MPVISPVKPSTPSESDISTELRTAAKALTSKQPEIATAESKADQNATSREQATQQTKATTAAKRMVQTANQWRNCSKPHRI